jgi:hypothetical protein
MAEESRKRYVAVSWDYVERLSRRVALHMIQDRYSPDCIVALAKGGWFVARILSDYLGVEKLFSLDIRFQEKMQKVQLKEALIVDDLISSGKTMKRAIEIVGESASSVKTAALFMLQDSNFIPDYLGEYLWDYSWVIFPWNFIEDVSELIIEVLRKRGEVSQWALKGSLFSEFGLDPLNLDISQPGRFEELLKVLELRGIIERFESGGRIYWRLREETKKER